MHAELWNSDEAWRKAKEGSVLYRTNGVIVLRFNKSSSPGLNDWSRPAFTTLYEAQGIILDVMRAIPGEHLGKVVISRMKPGDIIDWHIDPWPMVGIAPYFQRYQIPLSVSPGVRFVVEDEEVCMEPGTAWWFNNQKRHAVFNESGEDRISMYADIRPLTL